MVPVLIETPPTTLCFSTTATRFPALAAWIAARCPPGPEPMTTRSYCCMGGFLCSGLRGLGWGRRGRRLLALCERDSPMKLSRSARPVYISAGQGHQMFLDGKGLAVPAAPHMRVLAIGAEQAGFAVVCEIGRQNLLRDALAQGWILQREEHLDTLIQIARHPVRAAQINLRLAAVLEIKDAAVLQEAAYDAAHANPAADAAQAWHQGALPANNQVNFHARLRGPVQGANHRGIDHRVAFGDDSGGSPAPRVARFPFDQRDTGSGHVSRCQQQRLVMSFLRVGGEVVEHVVHR